MMRLKKWSREKVDCPLKHVVVLQLKENIFILEENVYKLKERIDSNNSAKYEEEIMAVKPAEIDASELEYISSAGLRVLLKLAKAVGEVSIVNVSPEALKHIL